MDTPDATLVVEWVPLARLHPNPANPRLNDPAVPHVAASIRRFGWRQPLVAKPSGELVAGHTRLLAAQSLGLDQVPVVWFEGSDLEATAYSIADNKTHEFASWDEPALAKLLAELRAEDALDGVGFSTEDIDALLDALQPTEPIPDADEVPPTPETPTTRPGDLWLLGNQHRLLCGDATSLAHVRRVMDGAQAALVATDPPYLVDYTGERPENSGKDWSATYREIDIEDAEGFFRALFTNVLAVLGDTAAVYCWHAHKRSGLIQQVWAELGLVDHQQIIWVKPTAVFGRVYWHFRHEPCVMGWRQGHMPEHDGVHEFNSVWEVDWEGKARIVGNAHPTQKPVEVFVRPIRKHTRVGDVVFEPFSGSGSQLIAAEQTHRRCRALEIEPVFVDVAVRRWEHATGKSATLEGDGATFAEITAERQAEPTVTAPEPTP